MSMSTGGGGSMLTEINVTPLVDVMLVLLIIFMVTAPMLQTGVDVNLPAGEGADHPRRRGEADPDGHQGQARLPGQAADPVG